MNTTRETEQLKDRRDYRRALQHRIAHSKSPARRGELEAKLTITERQISALNPPKKRHA